MLVDVLGADDGASSIINVSNMSWPRGVVAV